MATGPGPRRKAGGARGGTAGYGLGQRTTTNLTALRRDLLRWYDANQRTLPWREAAGGGIAAATRREDYAYRVLVSETMLQQTQVATVIPYFERFMDAFPTVAALAAADEQQVLRLWQGLGYYRRARNLHAAAGMIVDRFGGEVPATVEQLLELPGVGRYTAGAVASIAYGQVAPIVDGNVARVLARWFEMDEPVSGTTGRKRLWELAEQVVDEARPGDFNQSMMELGALVCTPREPKCGTCPVAKRCSARQAGRESELPVIPARRSRQSVRHVVVALSRRDGRYLFEQRPAEGLWSNMWQLVTLQDQVGDVAGWVRERYGLTICGTRRTGQFVHVTTHRDISFEVVRGEVTGGRLRRGVGLWRKLTAVDDLPLAKPQQRAIALLRTGGDE